MAESVRRSGRERKKNPKYLSPAVDEDDVEGILPVEDDSDVSSFEHIENEEEDDEDDVLAASEEEASFQGAEDDDGDGEEPEENLLPMDEDAMTRPMITHIRKAQKSRKQSSRKSSSRRKYVDKRESGLRSRGLLLHTSIMSKEITISEIAGFDSILTQKLKMERSKYGGTITLPYRETVGPGQSGLEYPEVFDQDVLGTQTKSFLEWYGVSEGWKTMAKIQAVTNLEPQDIDSYIQRDTPPQGVFLGPYDRQYEFSMNCLDSLSVSEAWKVAINNGQDSTDFDENASERSAWVLNVGLRVLAMDWAPCRTSNFQFLAVCVEKERPKHVPKVSSLEAEHPYESSIQIWAFKTRSEGDNVTMDMSQKPRLVHVVCTKWGVIRRLSWCPVGVTIEENPSSIGALATVSSDGHVRIIDVCVDMNSSNPYGNILKQHLNFANSTIVRYESAAFTSRPPYTICTCITWISADMLAAGCSDGHVAIWNITKCLQEQKTIIETIGQPITSAVPFWYHALHTTYIISIAAHQPYPCEYITTNGVDGKVRLTSIRNPCRDSSHGSRERHLVIPVVYSPHILGIYEIDETDGLRARPLRHFPVSRAVAKAPAQVMCLGAGKAHPTLLFGCADGSVIATNPTPRLFIRRMTHERVDTWQQIWFKHEFVPSARLQQADHTTSLHNEMKQIGYVQPRQGKSRFLESFKVETVSLNRNTQTVRGSNGANEDSGEVVDDEDDGEAETPAKKKKRESEQAKEPEVENVVGFEECQISIYEEEQAVTCLCWNSNIATGGWAAAGMANGLIRVEDLAV